MKTKSTLASAVCVIIISLCFSSVSEAWIAWEGSWSTICGERVKRGVQTLYYPSTEKYCLRSPKTPTLLRIPNTQTVNVGDDVTFVCAAAPGGAHIDFIKWQWKAKSSSTWTDISANANTYTIDSVKMNDDGKSYRCRVSNRFGSSFRQDSSPKQLVVVEPSSNHCDVAAPGKPTVIKSPDSSLIVGDTIRMICLPSTTDGPATSVKWYKVENDGSSDARSDESSSNWRHVNTYMISKTVQLDDNGTYVCEVSNCNYSQKKSEEVNLDVKEIPVSPTIEGLNTTTNTIEAEKGKNKSLECLSSGSGADEFKWYRLKVDEDTDDPWEEMQSGGQHGNQLVIGNVSMGDGGAYRCRERHGDVWSGYATMMLIVKESICSSLWTNWYTTDPDNTVEYRSQFCGEISSKGNITNWKLKKESRTKQVFEASFRSKKKFNKKLLDKSSKEFKDLSKEFKTMLKNAYKDPGTDVTITGFGEGSVIVHYEIVMTGTVNATDPGAVSKILSKYLQSNPGDANKYGVDPSSVKTQSAGGGNAGQKGTTPDAAQGQANLVLGVTLTIITFLVITIVVLVVFLMRLRRQLPKPASADDSVGFQARNGGVTMHGSQARESDPYACLGDPDTYNDGFYQGLSEQQRIARAREGGRGQMNAAYDADDDYAYMTEEEVNAAARDVQGGLEDGYRVNQGDPMYHVLEHEADQGASEAGTDAVYALGDQVTGTKEDPVYSLADNDNSDDYALPPKKKHGGVPLHSLAKKTKPEVKKKGLAYPPPQVGESEAVYSLEVKPDVRKRQQYDNTDDYSTPYAHAPGAGYPDENKMAAKGGPENAMADSADDYTTPFVHAPGAGYPGDNKMAAKGGPRNATAKIADDYSTPYALAPGSKTPDDSRMAARGGQGNDTVDNDEEYSRLQLPKLTDPKTMKNLGKGQKPANVVKAPAPDVYEDDDNDDYCDYGLACDVVVP